ncbi:Hsp70 protein-domain-containing protein [Phycomyces nitens]|nr:Hsp70 protein-domain-containing protein [Phycomyces nitens]
MIARWICGLVFTVALLSVFIAQGTDAAVMSIDYGTEWFKVGLIKSGIPLDVALNKDSKRKTQSVVTIRDNVRIYGSDAISLAGRFPQFTYFNLKSVLGKPYDDKHCQEFRHRFVNTMVLDPSRADMPAFHHNDTDILTVEELIAYQFQTARQQAINTAGEDVKDVVITVTPFANQYERQAILDAAELAGLKVLSLMHDETAVALNYAMNRQFEKTPEYHIFYDMGAGSTVASLVSFSNAEVKEGKRTKTYPQIEQHLARGFMRMHKNTVNADITDSDGAMARLLKEATRVKQILSANTETSASLEGLHEGIDFKMKVSRVELERLCADLLDRINKPIETALLAANMNVDDIKSIVLVGGSVRIPSVQRTLAKSVGSAKIAKNVNGDEAAVLGAAFRGASLSNQFRLTKQIKIKDVTVFPIEATYEPENSNGAIHTTIFKEFGSIGTRKIVTFKRTSDFEFELVYGKHAGKENLDKIAKIKVTGLTDAVEKYSEEIKAAENPPKVRVTIEMSDSGLISVPEASVSIEIGEGKSTFSEKVKSFFGSKEEKDSSKDEPLEHLEVDGQNNHSTVDNDAESSQNNTTKIPAVPVKEKEPTVTKIGLALEYIPTGPLPMSKAQKSEAAKRIKALDTLDELRRLREESRNALESSVYRLQDFLYDDTVGIVSTEEEQETLREHLSEISDWLYDEGEHAETSANVDRLKKLQLLEQPIVFRRTEYLQRPKNIDKISKGVEQARTFVQVIRATPKGDRYHTEEELESLLAAAESADKWVTEKVAAQDLLSNVAHPVLLTSEANVIHRLVEEALEKLKAKKKPKIVKKIEADNDTKAEEKSQEKTILNEEEKEKDANADANANAGTDDDDIHDEL